MVRSLTSLHAFSHNMLLVHSAVAAAWCTNDHVAHCPAPTLINETTAACEGKSGPALWGVCQKSCGLCTPAVERQHYVIVTMARSYSTTFCWALDQHPAIRCDYERFRDNHDVEAWSTYWAKCAYAACGYKTFPLPWSIQSTMPLNLTIQGPGGLPPRQAASSRYILLRRGNDTAHFESEQRAWNTGDWATSPSIRANRNQQRGAKDPARAPTLEAFMRKKKRYVEAWREYTAQLPKWQTLELISEDIGTATGLNHTTMNRVAQFLGQRAYLPWWADAMDKCVAGGNVAKWHPPTQFKKEPRAWPCGPHIANQSL